MKEIVVNVTTDVKNVLNMLIGLMEDTVLLVLMEELTTHHNVIVHMVILKSLKFVNHVTKTDVKPVLKMLIIVILVKLTEFNKHQNVHVILDSMKILMNNVHLVSLDVILVKHLKKTVLSVLVSELMHHHVSAQMVTSQMEPELVQFVLQNV